MIKWSRRQEVKLPRPMHMTNLRNLELVIAKEILKEVFHARPSDVEDMIQRRLEEKCCNEKSWDEDACEWPQEFCLSE